MILLAGLVFAEMPVPAYPDTLADQARTEVQHLAREDGVAAAADFVARWERTIGEDAGVEYELGLAWRRAGDEKAARTWLDRAIARDPDLVEARYDRGEVLLAAGDLDGAAEDFAVVVAKAPTAWPGLFRMADLAARRHDAAGFEKNLLAALRYGFPLDKVTADVHWRGYWTDAELGPIFRKLAEVYSTPEVGKAFDGPAESP